ncbi:MAG: sugar transferase [Ktedonobacteraceae bacterium]
MQNIEQEEMLTPRRNSTAIHDEVLRTTASYPQSRATETTAKPHYLRLDSVDKQWEMELQSRERVSLSYLCFHKILDLSFAICGTFLLLLLLPFLALLIHLDSPGPVFYYQERLGYRGKKFSLIKFRSMRTDAEAAGYAIWATENDPRVTRIGRLMRSIHLDELPQVLNILRGEMSLIGPRPEREEFVVQLEKAFPGYGHRLDIQPGLTGWAQVKYRYARSQADAFIKLQYDLYYITHRSIRLDIVIIFKTVEKVVFHHET